MSDTRLILAVGVDSLPAHILETGFHQLTDSNTLAILEDAETWFGPRDVLEEFDAMRQVIPYVIAVFEGKIVSYTRQPKGGESRLHGKVSFGLGGHIDLPDAQANEDGRFDIEGTLSTAAVRELTEELGHSAGALQQVGLLVENTTEVDRVHIGVVSVVHLVEAPIGAEDEIGEISLKTVEELMEISDRLENWSKVLLPHLNTLTGPAPMYGLGR